MLNNSEPFVSNSSQVSSIQIPSVPDILSVCLRAAFNEWVRMECLYFPQFLTLPSSNTTDRDWQGMKRWKISENGVRNTYSYHWFTPLASLDHQLVFLQLSAFLNYGDTPNRSQVRLLHAFILSSNWYTTLCVSYNHLPGRYNSGRSSLVACGNTLICIGFSKILGMKGHNQVPH